MSDVDIVERELLGHETAEEIAHLCDLLRESSDSVLARNNLKAGTRAFSIEPDDRRGTRFLKLTTEVAANG